MKWICAAVLLLSLAPPVRAAYKDCPMKELAALKVAIDEHGTVLIPVSIDGHDDVWMELALAQGAPTLFSAAVDGWNLKVRHRDVGASINGTRIDMIATIKALTVGHANFTGWSMLLIPAAISPKIEFFEGKPVVGELTSGFVQAVDVELNLAELKVNLFSQTTCGPRALYWGGEYTAVYMYSDSFGLLKFSMELDGHDIETSLNTASRDSVIYSQVTKKYFGFDETSPAIEKQVSKHGEIDSYRAMSLTAKGLAVRNAKIRIQSSGGCHPTNRATETGAIGCGDVINIAPFSIGTDLLRKLRVYIASRDHRIYFTRAEAAASVQ